MLLVELAYGYSFTGIQWDWQDHAVEDPFFIDGAAFPSDAGGDTAVQAAIETAMGDWNDVGRDATLTSAGLTTGASVAADGHFVITYATLSDMGGTLAFTEVAQWDTAGTAFDCDMIFLSSNDYGSIAWDSDPAGPESGRYDVQAVALHELGHCLGLDHSSDSTAVMYAYYSGLRTLASDDLAGFEALYGAPCVDGDGDGYTDCDADCDDANAAINPGATELCDGVDDNCDDVVDGDAPLDFESGTGFYSADTYYASAGNAYTVSAPSRLVAWQAHLEATEGDRLNWSIYRATSTSGPFELVRTDRGTAVAGEWQTSPTLEQPLASGYVYTFAVGGISAAQTYWYSGLTVKTKHGALKIEGAVAGRALGDDVTAVDDTYQFDQLVTVEDVADSDGDGQTTLCGDCDDDDATVSTAATESCNAVDDDCDGSIDEDYAVDADGDGTVDCLDPCPDDPADDADGDGACADVDPCPDDPADACDDTAGDSGDSGGGGDSGTGDSATGGGGGGGVGGAGGGDDSAPAVDTGKEAASGEPGGCGCRTGGGGGGIGLLAALVWARRRAR